MKLSKAITSVLLLIAINSHAFTISQIMRGKTYADGSGEHISNGYLPDYWFQKYNIQPANFAESTLISCSQENSKNCSANKDGIIKFALSSEVNKNITVMDLERWDSWRFSPSKSTDNNKTITKNLIESISYFKNQNKKSTLCIYSEVPQNIFSYGESQFSKFSKLNKYYQSVADLVDAYCPSNYNYGFDGTSSGDALWLKNATFNYTESVSFDGVNKSKPVIAFITPAYTSSSGTVVSISYSQMLYRLENLKAIGYSGAIVWAPSLMDMQPLKFDTNAGWFKALIDFGLKENSN